HPLTHRLARPNETAWGRYEAVSIVLVEVVTDSGLSGVGEALSRFAPKAAVEVIESALTPRLLGQEATAIGALWPAMSRAFSGRSGGVLMEAISGVDIALWDILGKVAGLPIADLLGGVGRKAVPVYAASVNWADEGRADDEVDAFLARGFDAIKVKIAGPVDAACRRIERVRARAGNATLCADANWAFTLDDAIRVGDALAAHGYIWFEEPLRPGDEAGYALLAERTPVPLAAGESNFTLDQAKPLVSARALGVLQPNVTRAGGITEARRMAEFAHMNDVAFAPHVGMSGIVCEVASLHLAAAMPNTLMLECACAPNAFKADLADIAPGYVRAENGVLSCPEGPGLGITIDWDKVAEMQP
ncbi:MAG: mandelate racemase/muconate lactonizing enzyme family protein, partial [Pseudomonadota bacterium]